MGTVAIPSIATVLVTAASASACESASMRLRDNQNIGGIGCFGPAVTAKKKGHNIGWRKAFASEIDCFIRRLMGMCGGAVAEREQTVVGSWLLPEVCNSYRNSEADFCLLQFVYIINCLSKYKQ